MRVVPPTARTVVPAALAALAVIAATGALAAAASLLWHVDRAGEFATGLDLGPVGGLMLLLVGVTLVPNAVVWASAYALGTGFAVGTGTAVAPTGVTLGAVPALPLLAALPGPGAAPRVSLLLLAGPVAAGVLAGAIVVRRMPGLTPARAAGWGLATGPVVGAAAVLACWLAGGPAGPGRLADVGPSPWWTGLAAAEWVGFGAAATAAMLARRRVRP